MAKFRLDFNAVELGSAPEDSSLPWDQGTYQIQAEAGARGGRILRKVTEAWHDLLRLDAFGTAGTVEFLARLRLPNPAGDAQPSGGIMLRASGVGGNQATGVLFNVSPFAVGIHNYRSGAHTFLGAYVFPQQVARLTYVWMRGRLVGNTAWVRAWVEGAAEPGAWQQVATTAEYPADGGVGVYVFYQNRIEADYLAIGTNGDAPPAPAEGDPPPPPPPPPPVVASPLTARRVQYEVRVATPGAPDVEGHVDFVIPGSYLANEVFIPGPVIRPANGRTETQPTTLEIIDKDGVITQHIADAAGRMHLLGRLVEIRESVNGGPYQAINTGRLSELSEPRGPGLWVMQLDDERWMERARDIFTEADTTVLWPPGLKSWWRSAVGRGYVPPTWQTIKTASGGRRRVEASAFGRPIFESVLGWLESDVIDTPMVRTADAEGNSEAPKGSFVHARLRIGATDYEIVTFGDLDGDTGGIAGPLRAIDTSKGNAKIRVWIIAPDPIQEGAGGYIHPGVPAEPDEVVPLHIGMGDPVSGYVHRYGTPTGSIHPFELTKRIYDDIGVRYDEALIEALIADSSYPPVAFRVTQKWNAATFLEDNIYSVFGVIPFPHRDGRLMLRSVRLPNNIDPESLFRFHPGNTAQHPTFFHGSRDVLNQITFRYLSIRQGAIAAPNSDTGSADALIVREFAQTYKGSTVDTLGKHPVEYSLLGNPTQHELQDWDLFLGDDRIDTGIGGVLEAVIEKVNSEALQRFEDGPQRGTMQGMPETEAVRAGDFVVLDFPTYPNAVTNSRGGARIVQIVRRDRSPAGPDFEFLDIGPFLQPLPQPTVAVAPDLAQPDRIIVTIGAVPAGVKAQLEVGWGSPGQSPTSFAQKFADLGAGSIVIDRAPEMTTVWARARNTAPKRISSLWKTTSLTLSTAPRLIDAAFVVEDTATLLRYRATPSVTTLRVYYHLHLIGAVAPDVLTQFVDIPIAVQEGSLPLPAVVVPPGYEITGTLYPYKGVPTDPQAQRGEPFVVLPTQNVTAIFTSFTQDKITEEIRRVTLTAVPGGATIHYRVNNGAWTDVVTTPQEGSTSFTITLAGRTTLEWYATLGTQVEVPTKSISLDIGGVGSIEALELSEPRAGVLRAVARLDDDIVLVEFYAKLGAPPRDASGTLDPLARKERPRRDATWWESRVDPGTWYVTAVGTDSAGRQVETSGSWPVRGETMPPLDPALGVLAVQPIEIGGVWYHEVKWGLNSVVEAGGYTVTLYRNGVQLVTGRDARRDANEALPGVPGGGYRVAFIPASAEAPGAAFRTDTYELRLFDNTGADTNLRATTTISAWHQEEIPAVQPPTETPTAPRIVPGDVVGRLVASWSNSTSWRVRIRWYKDGVQYSQSDLAQGVTADNEDFTAGAMGDAQLQYFNAGGAGPWGPRSRAVRAPSSL